MYKILIVEDEKISADYLKSILVKQGWDVVEIVDNAIDVIRSVNSYKPDLILMDIMINGPISGCEAAINVRTISNCHIIFLTAFVDEEMISYAADAKADGYLMKPYNEQEIIANISLLFSKSNDFIKDIPLIENTYLNYQNDLLYQDGEVVKLGPKSLKIIQTLCRNKNSYISYEELYKNIWNDEFNLKKLQMMVCRIREVVGENFIENIQEKGYIIKSSCK